MSKLGKGGKMELSKLGMGGALAKTKGGYEKEGMGGHAYEGYEGDGG